MSFSKRLPNKVIIKAKQGDKFAITQIYNTYKTAILGLSFRILQDKSAADDILQQVIEKVMLKLINLHDPSKFNGWLKTLTYRANIDYINKGSKELSIEELEDVGTSSYEKYDESALDLEKYLMVLNERERLVIILFIIEGSTHKEIAEKLYISEVNSKQIYRRSLIKLKELVKKESYGGVLQG